LSWKPPYRLGAEIVPKETPVLASWFSFTVPHFSLPAPVQPEVTGQPERTPSPQLRDLLLCSATGFYSGDIKIRWFWEEGVIPTGLIRNGDWTFQTVVMLEMTPEIGDVCTCLVDHPSLLSPVSVEWSENQLLVLSGSI
uniref:Ig-like domain-containing protein n=1 Tax=Catagonus wagneri TaxID=51154 RepID=A0A8C3YM29_9CETA